MLAFLKRPPFVGVIAFMAVLAIQPLGHIVMILMEQVLPEGDRWVSPFFSAAPDVPHGHVEYYEIENGLYQSAFALGLSGLLVIFWGVRRNTEIAGTWAGFLGGSLLWTGWVEFSLHFYARLLAVPTLCSAGNWAHTCAEYPATKPEYFLMQASVGFLVAMMVFFVLNKESRCNAFRWMHRNLGMKVGEPTRGLKRNFATIVAIETITILWFFHVFLMFLYDETVFGEEHWFTHASFAGFLLWSLYLMSRLIRYKRVTSALRYAIPTAIIFWNAIEIMGRWDWFHEFWIHPLDFKWQAATTLVALIVFVYISVKTALDRSWQIE